MIDFSNGIQRLPILKDIGTESDDKGKSSTNSTEAATTPSNTLTSSIMVVAFDKHGKKIYTGSSKGYIGIIDTETRTVSFFCSVCIAGTRIRRRIDVLWRSETNFDELSFFHGLVAV